ncbi:MAG: hypothetical protein IJ400_00580 [Clostridia bacterium]|nr:hypothetical protein [Clostridia bacterium]
MTLREYVKTRMIKNLVHTIVKAYKIMVVDDPFHEIPIENTRRNYLVETIKSNKLIKHSSITTEESTYDKTTYLDMGRMDISIRLDFSESKLIVAECKRFINGNITKSNFDNEYVGEGIERFTKKKIYPCPCNYAIMIAFLETGDFSKLNTLLSTNLNIISNNFCDVSRIYSHSYCYEGDISAIRFVHVLMDFSAAKNT